MFENAFYVIILGCLQHLITAFNLVYDMRSNRLLSVQFQDFSETLRSLKINNWECQLSCY